MSIAVHTPDGPYAAAIAELPLSAHRSPERHAAIVVISGRAGWAGRLDEAVAAGARAVILREPEAGDLADLDAAGAAAAVPIIVDRPLLRSDLVDDVRAGAARAPALVQVECSASGAEFAAVARDAVGWARVLAGGALALEASRSTARGFSALLSWPGDDSVGGVPVSIVATRRSGTDPWIRAIALGVERTEVTIDVARGSAVVERTSEAGRVIHPTRWESAERVVVRRAIEALESESIPSRGSAGLADLDADARLAAAADRGDALG